MTAIEKLARLPAVYWQEIAQAREDHMPAEAPLMQSLLKTNEQLQIAIGGHLEAVL